MVNLVVLAWVWRTMTKKVFDFLRNKSAPEKILDNRMTVFIRLCTHSSHSETQTENVHNMCRPHHSSE